MPNGSSTRYRSNAGSKAVTQLYRHYDAEGNLLYVGISLSAVTRLCQHLISAPWVLKIATIKVENFPTRKHALDAERKAIATEKPWYNQKMAVSNVRSIDLYKKLPEYSAHLRGSHKYVKVMKDRHGRMRYYLRHQFHQSIAIKSPFGSEGFFKEYVDGRLKTDIDLQERVNNLFLGGVGA